MDYAERHEKLYEFLSKGKKPDTTLMNQYSVQKNEFQMLVDNCIERQGLKRAYVIEQALLPPGYGYKLLNGQKKTKNRNYILRLLIAMKMPIEEVQHALQCYGLPPLDQSVVRDDIIIVGIEHQESLSRIEQFLIQAGVEEPLVELD